MFIFLFIYLSIKMTSGLLRRLIRIQQIPSLIPIISHMSRFYQKF